MIVIEFMAMVGFCQRNSWH